MSPVYNRSIDATEYWNLRFGSGDWASNGGYAQTRMFADSQLPYLHLTSDFTGRVLDRGCGAWDAFPVYRAAWLNAKLIGVDFSADANQLCRNRYGQSAEFVSGGIASAPPGDIVICSNVLEPVEDDVAMVGRLLKQCGRLYIVVPYKVDPLSAEHVRYYGIGAFRQFNVARTRVFKSRGWTELGLSNMARIAVGNLWRSFRGQPMRRRRMQILFEIADTSKRIR